jgi:CHAT domain-containing protein
MVDTLLWQAVAARQLARPSDYQAAIDQASVVAEKIPDHDVKERELNNVRSTRALCSDGKLTMAEMEQSVTFVRESANRWALPRILLIRGQNAAKSGDYELAMNSFAEGIAEIIAQRRTATMMRYELLNRSCLAEIANSAEALAVGRRDFERAFRMSELAEGAALPDAQKTGDVPLGPRMAMIKTLALPDRVVLWLVTSEGKRITQVPVSQAELTGAVHALDRDPLDLAASDLLGRLVLAPFTPQLSRVQTIVFVFDAMFANVRPSLLMNPASGRRLCEDFVVSQSRTVEAFARAAGGMPAESLPVLLIDGSRGGQGPPLPEAAVEVEELDRIYQGRARIWSEGTVGSLEAELRSAALVHFAAHGAVNRDNHLLSGILLGPRNSVLYAHEIAAMELQGRPIVVLSSCLGSASGGVRNLRMPSLADAFVAAGASAVVSAPEQVDDTAARRFSLMLHGRLRRGMTVGAAIRDVQLSLKKAGAPWAAFDVVGNPNARLSPDGTT